MHLAGAAAVTFAILSPLLAADLNLSALDGSKVRLRDLRGQIVVLNFWATWCGPCKEELPLLAATANEYKDKGVTVVAVSLDEKKDRPRVAAFVKERQLSFPVWTGASGDDLDRFKLGEAVPATAFLDSNGRIVARISGQLRPNEIKARLDWLLSGRSEPFPEPFVQHLASTQSHDK